MGSEMCIRDRFGPNYIIIKVVDYVIGILGANRTEDLLVARNEIVSCNYYNLSLSTLCSAVEKTMLNDLKHFRHMTNMSTP